MFVVKTDTGTRPAWLGAKFSPKWFWQYVRTEVESEACVFAFREDAQKAADDWSDVPGVWYVARIANKEQRRDQRRKRVGFNKEGQAAPTV